MTIATTEFQFVADLVRKHAGIVLEAGKEYLVESRLRPIVTAEGLSGFPELVSRVKAGTHALLQQKVISAMTTNETSFFRDLHPFEALRSVILPDLIAKRAATRTLNIWCAASSTGQEPYTIAMILAEHFPQLASWKIHFLATDLSDDVLTKAREGRFGQIEINRGLPAKLLVKYFIKEGADWQIKEPLRKMIEFKQMNLTATWPIMPSFDVIFIRNVLIYFDTPTKTTILAKARGTMKPDGYLFLGGAETTLGIDNHFERVPLDRSGAYRLAANPV